MKVGFTGTRAGMTARQKAEVAFWLDRLSMTYVFGAARFDASRQFRHGMCVGADAEAHALAREADYGIIGHPGVPEGDPMRAALPAGDFLVVNAVPKPRRGRPAQLVRDEHIVDAVDVMLVAPRQRCEVLRSGTWTTYRYAQKQGKTCIMVWP